MHNQSNQLLLLLQGRQERRGGEGKEENKRILYVECLELPTELSIGLGSVEGGSSSNRCALLGSSFPSMHITKGNSMMFSTPELQESGRTKEEMGERRGGRGNIPAPHMHPPTTSPQLTPLTRMGRAKHNTPTL